MRVATGSGCPSAAVGSTATGMLWAAETLVFDFACVLVPFVPAQVYLEGEGGQAMQQSSYKLLGKGSK